MRYGSVAITTIAVITLATPAVAETFYDEARVLDTQPIYQAREVPVSVQQCGYEQPSTPSPVDPAMLGDAQVVDPGSDLLGALHRDIELRGLPAEVYRCRMVTRTESKHELAGYRVRYEYQGRVYERRVAKPPGDTIRVSVQLNAGRPDPRRWR